MTKRVKRVVEIVRVSSKFNLFAFLLIGVAIGTAVMSIPHQAGPILQGSNRLSIRLDDPEYKLISPLIIGDSGLPGNQDIENKLKLTTYDLLNIPNVQTVSIYYRDLKSGTWAGVKENTEYDPASLLKVPIMIAWYKEAEDDPGILSRQLLYAGGPNDNKGIDFYSLTPGMRYTVSDLIDLMITKSDNDAKDLLLENLDPSTINSVFSDLGIQIFGTDPGNSEHISPAIYSRFLRILYNASYLDRDYSEKALDLMAKTDFNDGIVAGVPAGVSVAHKFGEFENASGTEAELHDCGIIYHPTNPYLLCVMTSGTGDVTKETLENVIKATSKAVYDIVNNTLAKN